MDQEPMEDVEDPCPDVDALLDFVEKRLNDTDRVLVRQHLERCPDCMAEVATALTRPGAEAETASLSDDTFASRPPGSLAAPQLGRFQILSQVGSGGMGEVFSAYDPQLNRRVAIKVLKRSHHAIDQARFTREAQALARISHPNVVPIHEAGTHGDSLFIAMEFVEGVTLKEWSNNLDRERDNLGRMLEVLQQAGEGLAAAHESGLVHRDFKPSNVLVGKDGRVRVVDFGVARSSGVGEAASLVDASIGPMSEATLTQTGYAIGTPAYMAPEQLLGTVSAASDQFAFCTVAWEVLFGTRPFIGHSSRELLVNIQSQVVLRPATVRIPQRIEAALRRGLAVDPDQRFPTMQVLLSELRRGHQHRGWRSLTVAGGGMAAFLLALGGAAYASSLANKPCTDSASRLSGVWDPAARERVGSAIREAQAAEASDIARRVEKKLDNYTRAWMDSHREACEASRVRGELPLEVMELRMACLDTRLSNLSTLVEKLANGKGGGPPAENLLEDLAPVESCQDTEYIRLDPSVQPSIDTARQLLTNADSLRAKGYLEASREMASMALAKASGQDVPCLEIEANLALAKATIGLGQYEESRRSVDDAHRLRAHCAQARAVFEHAGVAMSSVGGLREASVTRERRDRTGTELPGASPPPAAEAVIRSRVAKPGSSPRGKTTSQWQTEWSKWAMETPQRLFVFSDGADNYCAVNQSGDVRFLAGALNVDGNRSQAARTCVIPEGTALFFPVINEFHGAFDPKETEQKLRDSLGCAKHAAGVLEIDGVRLEDIRAHYSESHPFAVNLPKDNAFGVDESTVPGMRLEISVSAGHYFFVEPLPPGIHTLRWTAVNACTNLQVIDHTIVVERAE